MPYKYRCVLHFKFIYSVIIFVYFLGTTIRASVHIKLPKLGADREKLESVAGKFNLQVRGTTGEHTESVGGVYDVSNKRRIGLTEFEAVQEMANGIRALIQEEEKA